VWRPPFIPHPLALGRAANRAGSRSGGAGEMRADPRGGSHNPVDALLIARQVEGEFGKLSK